MANFPQDIVVDVLSRLPVKYVLRFKCVCKSWRFLISEPQFVKTHLNRATSDVNIGCHRVLIPADTKTLKSIDYESLQLLSKKKLRKARQNSGGKACTVLDFPWGCRRVSFVGSCHGMVCMVVDGDKIVLYNPCTREFRELPKPTSISIDYDKCSHINGGLGYDSYADDYKFVISVHEDGEFKAEVFSLRSNSWRILRDIPPDIFAFEAFGIGVFLNGALYWIARFNDTHQKIISFDLATEKFHELLSLPPRDQGNNNQLYPTEYWDLILQGGCLSVSAAHNGDTEIWVMKEYGVEASWTKLFSLNIRINEPMHHYLTPLCFTNNDELLVDVDSEIRIYNPKNQSSRKLYEGNWRMAEVVLCIESLVSPNGSNVENTPHNITQLPKKEDKAECRNET